MGSKVDAKVVLLGKEFSGKTSLVERYLHERFNENVPYQNDTAGSERYEAMSRIYYRGAKAAVLCYDLTDKSSFERAKFWVNELKTYEDNCKIYLCGTKHDLVQSDKKSRQVDYHTTTDYADGMEIVL
ncbi:Ras-related protein Rab-24 [Acropora cervicornis]|uniref:Ras-related protein Rab-24 n=1 Tax=Acropora cervicornis TaxID=6130 RepID=A0AAD9R449_ACRCE|nr:Ras-related protein Rab-24 [Acropora cervicornis]